MSAIEWPAGADIPRKPARANGHLHELGISVAIRLHCLGNRCHSRFDRPANASSLSKAIVIEPAENRVLIMLRGSRRWMSFQNIRISVRIASSNGCGNP